MRPILRKPVNSNYKIDQGFGFDNTNHPRRHDYYNHFGKKHPGVDFAMPVGKEVRAAFPGVVMRKEEHRGMGKVLGIRNGNIVSLYAHLNEFRVKLGDWIETGQLVGISGETGMTAGISHLHFELRDVTKRHLKDMVFEPVFDKPISKWKPITKCLGNFRFLARLLKWQMKILRSYITESR